jgi:hypothetical protein
MERKRLTILSTMWTSVGYEPCGTSAQRLPDAAREPFRPGPRHR